MINRNVKIKAFIWKKDCNIINVVFITFAQFKASLLNKIISIIPPKKKKYIYIYKNIYI